LERELTHRVGRGVRISARGRNILDIVVTGIDRIRDRTDLEIRENGHSIHISYKSTLGSNRRSGYTTNPHPSFR